MPTHRETMSRVLVTTLAVLVLLAGCGDDNDGGGADAITSSASSTPTPTPPASPAMDGDAVESGDAGDFCQLNEEITRLFGELALTGSEDTWIGIEEVVAQMPDASPPELESDVAVAMRYYPVARAELEAANWDVGILDSLPLDPDHAAAEETITAYLDANC